MKEDDDVILPCSLSTNENVKKMLFDWQKEGTPTQKNVFLYDDGKYYNNGLLGQDKEFKDRVSHFPEDLSHGNASIRIKKTRLEDNGTYSCKFPDLKQETKIKLVVGECLYKFVYYLKMKQSACTLGSTPAVIFAKFGE